MSAELHLVPPRSDLPGLCKAVTEHAPLPMATLEGATHIVRNVNPAFCKLMNKSAAQMVGRPCAEIMPANAACVALLDRVYRSGEPESHNEAQYAPSHPVFWTYTIWPLLAGEHPVGVMLQVTESAPIHTDLLAVNEALVLGSLRQHELTETADKLNAQLHAEIAERKLAEAAAGEIETRYRNLFNSMDEGFCVIDVMFDANEQPVDWRFVEVNPAFVALTGIHDIVGKRMRERVQDHEQYWFDTYGKVALTGEPIRFENRAMGLDDRWFDLYAFRIGSPEQRRVAVIFTNITERKKTDAALTALDHRKDEFLAMLSHELRNPLAPIINAVHLLRLQKNEDPVQRQARNIIERQVGQLTRLIDDLMEVSRLTSGRINLHEERLQLNGVVENAVETVRPLIDAQRHTLELTLSPTPIWLYADAARIEQVVVNLLTNAAKYTVEGGMIWLTVEQVGDLAIVTVRDTGVGIAADLLPHVFDLFTQGERSLDRSQGGLGIGLCLVQRLVEMHRGSVDVQSTLGKGSEFVVRLPVTTISAPEISAPVAPAAPVPSDETPVARPMRVLVVEDNIDAAETLTMVLSAFGHEIRIANDGHAAVSAAREFRPHVVLLDIGLPGLNGFEVAALLRAEPDLGDVVLIAMTGYGEVAARERSQAVGFDHHLVKPVDIDQILAILADMPAASV